MNAPLFHSTHRRSHLIFASISIFLFTIGFILTFRFRSQSLIVSFPSSTPLPFNPFLPIGQGTITLNKPLVEVNARPPGLLQDIDISTPLPIPSPHEPSLIGTDMGHLVYSNGNLQDMPDTFVWMHLSNTTFLSENVILYNNHYLIITEACHPRYWNSLYQQPETITYEYNIYESAICLGHQHSSDFGHWFLEVLPAYSVIPRDILLRSIVVLPEYHDYVIDGFKLLGINEDQIVAGLGIAVFAKNFYTAEFQFCGDLTKFLIVSFRTFLVKKFGLWAKLPTKFELYNRWNMSRSCGNFWEIFDAVKKSWPQFQWEECPHIKGIEGSARFFDEVKLLFGIHGSVLANMIFMQDNTAIVSVEMEQWLLSFLWLSAFTGKYQIIGRDPRITWRGLTPNILDVPYVVSLFKRALEVLKLIEITV